MKVRLAIAAAVLAMGVSAFTPTPTAAGQPSGSLLCLAQGNLVPLSFVVPGGFTLGEAVQFCVQGLGGHPVLIMIDP